MKIVLSGVETKNKGAELMLYAILQEIERRFPDAEVYIPASRIKQGIKYINTSLDLRIIPQRKIFDKYHIEVVFRLLHLPFKFILNRSIVKGTDWFFNGSGFAFGDQFKISNKSIQAWEFKLNALRKMNSKIVFLPQAFGPFEKTTTKKMLSVLTKYADILMPREQVSYNYLEESGIVNMQKVKKFTDFTSLVDGIFPQRYENLRNGICIIPNRQMIRKGKITYEDYIRLLTSIIVEVKKSGHPVYLLNHEGKEDADLCLKCKETIGGDIEAVTCLNALEVKGLIASAYMCVTSRFHGLASALNNCVPTLATSWSHKYEELYRDYGLKGYIIPLDNIDTVVKRLAELLDEKENQRIRNHIAKQVPGIKTQTREMWEYIWNIN